MNGSGIDLSSKRRSADSRRRPPSRGRARTTSPTSRIYTFTIRQNHEPSGSTSFRFPLSKMSCELSASAAFGTLPHDFGAVLSDSGLAAIRGFFRGSSAKLSELQNSSPPGYTIQVSGEQAKQVQGFKNLSVVMGISISLIFLALAFQFRHSIKPFLVLAAAPYGIVGALIALYVMHAPLWFHGLSRNCQPGRRNRQSRDRAV